jgi:hypothetical protein
MNMNRKLVGVLVGAAMAVGASVAHGQANLGVAVPREPDRIQLLNQLWRYALGREVVGTSNQCRRLTKIAGMLSAHVDEVEVLVA